MQIDETKIKRHRWLNRATFILASVGSAVGLGNFWRFPSLMFRAGGAGFFLPYFIALIFIGIPFLMLELGLGQKFQRGDIGVFRGILPRLWGIGLSSVLCALLVVIYYALIIAWALHYFILSFFNPLFWTEKRNTERCDNFSPAEDYFFKDFLHLYNKDCQPLNGAYGSEVFNWDQFLALLAVWVIMYFCVFKGVKSSSWVVWVTVPLPLVLIVILIIKGCTLPGAGTGIKWYLTGSPDVPPFSEQVKDPLMWNLAVSQIFFSLSVCSGVMTSFGSYNKVNKPIIKDTIIIAIIDSICSFLSGFAIFTIIGYLDHINNPVSKNVSSFGLVFIAYPTAMSLMAGANFWNILLFLTLLTLGLDSAFSLVEAIITVITDLPFKKKINRMLLTFLVCLFCLILGIPFCFDFGLNIMDITDHYVTAYLMIILGILQCVGTGWFYEWENVVKKTNLRCFITFNVLFWVGNLFWCIVPLFFFPDQVLNDAGLKKGSSYSYLGIIIFIFIHIPLTYIITFFMQKKISFKKYLFLFSSYGARKVARYLSLLSDPNNKKTKAAWWEPIFEIWWVFSIKFFIPIALTWIFFSGVIIDLQEPYYGKYPENLQWIGFVIVLVGLLFFIVPLFIYIKAEPFSFEVDQEFEKMTHDNKFIKGGNKNKSDEEIQAMNKVRDDQEEFGKEIKEGEIKEKKDEDLVKFETNQKLH